MNESHIFGGGTSQTLLHPVVLVMLLIAIVCLLVLPRKYMIMAFLLSIFLIPMGQQIYFGGMHWYLARIIILVSCLRLISGKLTSQESLVEGGFNAVDLAFLGCILIEAICVTLQYKQAQAFFNQFGFLVDYIGGYLVV